jgi:hypothetical protein
MTKNLKLFTFFCVIWALVYTSVLYRLIETGKPLTLSLMSWFVVLTVVLTSVERELLKRDNQRKVRYHLPLRYSILSAITSSAVSAIWILAWKQEIWSVLILWIVSILVILGIAASISKERIKSIRIKDLFK